MLTKIVSDGNISSVQKRAIFKIAVELVKADSRIHKNEISILDKLQSDFALSQEELDLIHYSSLAYAVSVIREMPDDISDEVLSVFNQIMSVDSDVAFNESLILSAIMLSCKRESKAWATVLSTSDVGTDIPARQIVFVEKSHSDETHCVLDDKYDNLLITKALGDIGFDLFYLPNVLSKYTDNKLSLLKKSIGYLRPLGDMLDLEYIEDMLKSFDSDKFFKVLISRLNLRPEFFPYESCLLIKIKDSNVLDDNSAITKSVDFLCLDISSEVKKRILSFVSWFEDSSYSLPYDGYYKLLFDHLSSERKILSSILIDNAFNFLLKDIEHTKVVFESAPQAKTLYLVLLYYGQTGISQDCFNRAIEFLQSDKDGSRILKYMDTDWGRLIYNTAMVYSLVSSKNETSPDYMSYILSILVHRSSLKTYINKGFSEISSLSRPELYHVRFDKEMSIYYVDASVSFFSIENSNHEGATTLSKSFLWKSFK